MTHPTARCSPSTYNPQTPLEVSAQFAGTIPPIDAPIDTAVPEPVWGSLPLLVTGQSKTLNPHPSRFERPSQDLDHQESFDQRSHFSFALLRSTPCRQFIVNPATPAAFTHHTPPSRFRAVPNEVYPIHIEIPILAITLPASSPQAFGALGPNMSSVTSPTPAQEEFNSLVARNEKSSGARDRHPEDRDNDDSDRSLNTDDELSLDEEDRYKNAQIDTAMRMSTVDHNSDGTELKLPPASFDSGRATGVKGVIADARHYEMTKKSKWRSRARAVRNSVFGLDGSSTAARGRSTSSSGESDEDGAAGSNDEESFLKQWRESRRRELESENRSSIRNRRTSPSVRVFGRLDEVDALGYLDAIEKVGRETVVVVFVHDHECMVSSVIESAIRPLVSQNSTVHFVKVHYEAIEFDNAGVPAILAYRNQGDLFANLTGLVEMIPDEEYFDSSSLETILRKQHIL
ncbi:hypothetical protein MKZ38_009122 [Zalerion maritima]|uniref:Phosducin domain-containing protein n=1 Tax=Zalerion maritima TaxID=339359 RepID=A0AAD5RGH4_9PEZI|nr:hypothetical protein MKZ38_009122 [Zalerion maritima]